LLFTFRSKLDETEAALLLLFPTPDRMRHVSQPPADESLDSLRSRLSSLQPERDSLSAEASRTGEDEERRVTADDLRATVRTNESLRGEVRALREARQRSEENARLRARKIERVREEAICVKDRRASAAARKAFEAGSRAPSPFPNRPTQRSFPGCPPFLCCDKILAEWRTFITRYRFRSPP
jgi:hypothetical protein